MSARMKILRRLFPAMAVALAFLLGGCAVMRIDVDVYKGPLGNDEVTQLQQFQSMAPGMHQVLVQLRDRSEWGDWPVWQCDGSKAKINSFMCPSVAYSPKPMQPKVFTKSRAVRVNAVLSLFEDQVPDDLSNFSKKIDLAYEIYLRQLEILGADQDRDRKLWLKFSKKFISGKNGAFKIVNKFYRQFLDPGNRYRMGSIPKLPKSGKECQVSDLHSSNARFRALMNETVVRCHADVLYSADQVEEKNDFISNVIRIASSFHASRRALRQIWQLARERIGTVNELSLPLAHRVRITAALAELLSKASQPEHIAVAMQFSKVPPPIQTDLFKILTSFTQGIFNWKSKVWENTEFSSSAAALTKALFHEPKLVSFLLGKADLLLKEFPGDATGFNKYLMDLDTIWKKRWGRPHSLKFREGRRYGIVRGPTLSDEDTRALKTALDQTINAVRGAGGLDRGRPKFGVFTLVEKFIESERVNRRCVSRDCKKKQVDVAREELTQGLIHFSQKILAIADNDVLLPPLPSNTDWKNGSSEYSGSGSPAGSPGAAFVPVLQAIGNTFIIQADELTARARHKRKLEDRRGPDRLGLEFSLSRNPGQVINDLLVELKGKLKEPEKIKTKSVGDKKNAETDLQAAKNKIKTATNQLKGIVKGLPAAKKSLDEANKVAGPAIYAYRTLIGDFEEINDSLDLKESVKALLDDRNAIQKYITDNGKPMMSVVDVKALVVSWLDGERKPALATALRQRRLVAAIDFFKNKSSDIKGGSSTDPRAKSIAELNKKVTSHYITAKSIVVPATSAVSATETEQKTAQDNIDAGKVDEKLRAETKKSAENMEQGAEAMIKKIKDTLAIVEELGADTAFAASKTEAEKDPLTLFALLRNNIAATLSVAKKDQSTANAGTDAAKKKSAKERVDKLTNAKSVLASYPVPNGRAQIAALPDRTKKGDQRDVLDDLIASLRYADIEAERSGQSSRAQSIEVALKKAYEYRAGMVYIRPASSYLRSSYAATSLQGDPTLGWRNMLSRHTARSLPFGIGAAFTNDDRKIEEIRAALDKQFWQNINSVRVAGGGITNYAMIKDDIGNWSVKSFSADPTPIIKGAQSLALFNLGGSLNTNLLRVNELRATPNLDEGQQRELNLLTERTTGASPALKRLFEHHETRYVDRTGTQYLSFRTTVNGTVLRDRVKVAWEKSLRGAEAQLRTDVVAIADKTGPVEEAQKKVVNETPPPVLATTGTDEAKLANRQERRRTAETMGNSILGALGDLNRYRTALISETTDKLNIGDQRNGVNTLTSNVQGINQEIAVLEAEIKQLESTVEKLKTIHAAAETTRQPQIQTDLTEKENQLRDKRAGHTEKSLELAIQTAKLGEAKSTLALREIQLSAVLRDANRILGSVILDTTRKRADAISAFEQAILFVGDTPGPSASADTGALANLAPPVANGTLPELVE